MPWDTIKLGTQTINTTTTSQVFKFRTQAEKFPVVQGAGTFTTLDADENATLAFEYSFDDVTYTALSTLALSASGGDNASGSFNVTGDITTNGSPALTGAPFLRVTLRFGAGVTPDTGSGTATVNDLNLSWWLDDMEENGVNKIA